jgi:hypothetical protein
MIKDNTDWFLSPAIIAWCAQVTDAPELNNKKVFNNGIFA